MPGLFTTRDAAEEAVARRILEQRAWLERVAQRYASGSFDTENAVGEAIFRVWKALPAQSLEQLNEFVAENHKLANWMAKILKNASIDAHRKATSWGQKPSVALDGAGEVADPLSDAKDLDFGLRLDEFLAHAQRNLSPHLFSVLRAKMDGLTLQDLARRFEVTVDAIRSALHRALTELGGPDRIRAEYGLQLPEEPPATPSAASSLPYEDYFANLRRCLRLEAAQSFDEFLKTLHDRAGDAEEYCRSSLVQFIERFDRSHPCGGPFRGVVEGQWRFAVSPIVRAAAALAATTFGLIVEHVMLPIWWEKVAQLEGTDIADAIAAAHSAWWANNEWSGGATSVGTMGAGVEEELW